MRRREVERRYFKLLDPTLPHDKGLVIDLEIEPISGEAMKKGKLLVADIQQPGSGSMQLLRAMPKRLFCPVSYCSCVTNVREHSSSLSYYLLSYMRWEWPVVFILLF